MTEKESNDITLLKTIVKDMLGPKIYKKYLDDVESAIKKEEERPCLIEAYFRKEAEKPAQQRVNYCYISCSCKKCNPYHFHFGC